MWEKKKLKKNERKTKKYPLLHANHQVLLPNRITNKKILLFIKKLESFPRLRKAGGSYQKIWLNMPVNFSKIYSWKRFGKKWNKIQSSSHEHRQIKRCRWFISRRNFSQVITRTLDVTIIPLNRNKLSSS